MVDEWRERWPKGIIEVCDECGRFFLIVEGRSWTHTPSIMSLGIKMTKQIVEPDGVRPPMECDALEPVEDVVSEVRAYRLAIQGWAKGYAAARLLTPSGSKVDGETAGEDLRRWSRLYFAASRSSRREADLANLPRGVAGDLRQVAREQSL